MPVSRLLVLGVLLAALGAEPGAAQAVLRLATTTSTEDSGLLRAILPGFERQCRCRVEVVAVGTGQAIAIARRGDADVLLVHARALEEQFVAEGHGGPRLPVMCNDFVVVGPAGDPAGVARAKLAVEAFRAIAARGAVFASRGDRSGTHVAEQGVWQSTGIVPAARWYRSLGQGMGETLMTANELGAYTLSDRGTWLSMRERLANLRLLVGGASPAASVDPLLRNQYSVIVVSAAKHPGVAEPLARRFAEWVRSPATQRTIGAFGVERFGQPLFYPNAGRRP
jgi:tungstate transport system substrate-binding protein